MKRSLLPHLNFARRTKPAVLGIWKNELQRRALCNRTPKCYAVSEQGANYPIWRTEGMIYK
jgi:hypothetical protein